MQQVVARLHQIEITNITTTSENEEKKGRKITTTALYNVQLLTSSSN